LKYNS
jgi:hypothetical protein